MREISEKEFQELTNSYSIKSEYQKLIGKDVTPERFLFCCYEVTKHLKETDMNFRNKNLWPELQDGACPEGEIENAIDSLTKWYAENLPQLTKKKPVDFESMWHICVDLAHLEKDFSDLVGRHTDEVLEDHLLDEDELAGVWIALKDSLTRKTLEIFQKELGHITTGPMESPHQSKRSIFLKYLLSDVTRETELAAIAKDVEINVVTIVKDVEMTANPAANKAEETPEKETTENKKAEGLITKKEIMLSTRPRRKKLSSS